MIPYIFNSSPYQQVNNFVTPNFQNYRTPFSIPRSNFGYINPMAGKINGKFTINKFLSGAENMISTVNQVIPIYQQVKPLWDNTKNFRNKLKNFNPFNNRNTQTQNVVRETIINPEVINPDEKKETQQKNNVENKNSTSYKNQEKPNKPFF
ncbi:MAG: hypothetical protein ACI311_00520 [Bacilli bacterium]